MYFYIELTALSQVSNSSCCKALNTTGDSTVRSAIDYKNSHCELCPCCNLNDWCTSFAMTICFLNQNPRGLNWCHFKGSMRLGNGDHSIDILLTVNEQEICPVC